MFQLAQKHGILNEIMERDGYGDMNYESFAIECMHSKSGIIPEKYTKIAGEIHTKICTKLQNLFENSEPKCISIEDFFQENAKIEMDKISEKLSKNEIFMVENALYGCFRNILIGYTGDEIKYCNAYYFGSAQELPGGDLILPQNILEIFYKEIPNLKQNLKLNHKVENISWNESKIEILANNQIFQADYCICTFPPGVIQKFHENLFTPKLPENKIEAYKSICPGAVAKYFIEWDKPWRPKNDSPIMIAWAKSDIKSMKLPEDWIRGIFELSVEDPLGKFL